MNDCKLELVIDNPDIPAKPGRQEPPSGDWLSGMESGTEFLCRDKTGHAPRWMVFEYIHGGKIQGNVLLIPSKTVNDTKSWMWADPVEFCRSFEYRGVLEDPGIPDRSDNDGNRDQEPD